MSLPPDVVRLVYARACGKRHSKRVRVFCKMRRTCAEWASALWPKRDSVMLPIVYIYTCAVDANVHDAKLIERIVGLMPEHPVLPSALALDIIFDRISCRSAYACTQAHASALDSPAARAILARSRYINTIFAVLQDELPRRGCVLPRGLVAALLSNPLLSLDVAESLCESPLDYFAVYKHNLSLTAAFCTRHRAKLVNLVIPHGVVAPHGGGARGAMAQGAVAQNAAVRVNANRQLVKCGVTSHTARYEIHKVFIGEHAQFTPTAAGHLWLATHSAADCARWFVRTPADAQKLFDAVIGARKMYFGVPSKTNEQFPWGVMSTRLTTADLLQWAYAKAPAHLNWRAISQHTPLNALFSSVNALAPNGACIDDDDDTHYTGDTEFVRLVSYTHLLLNESLTVEFVRANRARFGLDKIQL